MSDNTSYSNTNAPEIMAEVIIAEARLVREQSRMRRFASLIKRLMGHKFTSAQQRHNSEGTYSRYITLGIFK